MMGFLTYLHSIRGLSNLIFFVQFSSGAQCYRTVYHLRIMAISYLAVDI